MLPPPPTTHPHAGEMTEYQRAQLQKHQQHLILYGLTHAHPTPYPGCPNLPSVNVSVRVELISILEYKYRQNIACRILWAQMLKQISTLIILPYMFLQYVEVKLSILNYQARHLSQSFVFTLPGRKFTFTKQKQIGQSLVGSLVFCVSRLNNVIFSLAVSTSLYYLNCSLCVLQENNMTFLFEIQVTFRVYYL